MLRITGLIVALLVAAPRQLEAQVAMPGFAPFRLQPSVINLASVRAPDHEALMEADAAQYRAKHGGGALPQTQEGARFADAIERNISLDEFRRQAVEGGTVHTVRIISPGALGLQVNFAQMVLPAGARMFVYSNDTTRGAFTDQNNKPNHHFAVVPVPGEAATVEVFVPDRAAPAAAMVISSVAHHYRETFFKPRTVGGKRQLQQTRCQTSPPFTGYMCSLACQPNINCLPQGAAMDQKHADVKLIHGDGTGMCSAQMITNAAQDGRQLLTTAHHCESTDLARPTEDWIAVFDYRCVQPDLHDIAPHSCLSGAGYFTDLHFALCVRTPIPTCLLLLRGGDLHLALMDPCAATACSTPGCVDPEEEPSLANSVQGTRPLYRDILISRCPGWPGSGAPGSPADPWWECGGTDIMVVEMLETIPESYEVFMNGFNAENGVPHAFAGPTGISHPAGDVTKLALSRAPAGVNSWRQPGPADTHWSVVWEVGGNQGGSSGSAVFDAEGYQRGVLTGGSGSCTRQLGQRSSYGRFGFGWNRRGWEWASESNSGPELKSILDPEERLECTPWRTDPEVRSRC